ncbi:MAG TPA: Wzz/FepE/Etk N-terminal domain-containing protein [Bacteroidales bacterium]|nr:Wzz/FepE/Etk N-terminal domain-containing protein [Bacteroidales bacterium]HPS17644.1 Wzz/FepE/Etk N-terminal domain-containing protein [Bacteroidales bacterium]
MTETQTKKENKDSEIDLIDIAKKIWSGRKIIIKSMIVFFVLGIFIVIFSPKEYKSEITLVVETSSSGSGMSGLLQQFGGLAGISMNKTDKEALVPDLYPEVIKSTPFLLEIMKQKVIESKYDSTLTVEQYLDRHTRSSLAGFVAKYTIGLPGKIMEWIRGKNDNITGKKLLVVSSDSLKDISVEPIRITKKQSDIIEALAGCISTEQDFKKSNKFVIGVEMQDPLVVAQVTSYVVKDLKRYIIDYRTKKAKTDLKFVEARSNEAEAKYMEAQQALAIYKDRNKNVILASVQTEEERLQSEYDLSFSLYSALAKQLEQSKIKVQEETPVFNVMDPAQIPLKKSSPKSSLIIITMLFLGGCVGVGIILLKNMKVILINNNQKNK